MFWNTSAHLILHGLHDYFSAALSIEVFCGGSNEVGKEEEMDIHSPNRYTDDSRLHNIIEDIRAFDFES